jgi:hypothetical protein
MRYFAFENVAREAAIPDDRLQQLCQGTRREFPHDDMMYELHVLRACMAVRDGLISVEAALAVGSGSKERSPRRTP